MNIYSDIKIFLVFSSIIDNPQYLAWPLFQMTFVQ